MCLSRNSSRLNVASSVFFMTGMGVGVAEEAPMPTHTHTEERGSLWVLQQDIAATTAQHKKLYRRDVMGEM